MTKTSDDAGAVVDFGKEPIRKAVFMGEFVFTEEKSVLTELISELELTEHGSGRLDDAIYRFLGYRRASTEDAWIKDDKIHYGSSPGYTSNLETAKDLIETGMLFSVEGNAGDYQEGRYGKARIWCAPEYSKIKSMAKINVTAKGASPALALCAAALKAKLAG